MVHHNYKTSLVVEVKSKQHLDPLSVELKDSVLSNYNESFSQGGMVHLGIKVGCAHWMWMTKGDILWKRNVVLDISFIHVPKNCIMIFKRSIGGTV